MPIPTRIMLAPGGNDIRDDNSNSLSLPDFSPLFWSSSADVTAGSNDRAGGNSTTVKIGGSALGTSDGGDDAETVRIAPTAGRAHRFDLPTGDSAGGSAASEDGSATVASSQIDNNLATGSGMYALSAGPGLAEGGAGAHPAADAAPATTSNFHINLEFDSFAMAAPQSFRDGMQSAASLIEAAFANNITVNISVGYGEFNGTPLSSQSTSTSNALGITESYQNLRSLLASHETSADDATAVNSLPNTTSLEGHSSFLVGNGLAKALGAISAGNANLDGLVGIGTNFTGNLLIAGALHELTQAMGRLAGFSLDLFRYNEDGSDTHVFGSTIPATAAYFSFDGGTTKLADFGINSDPGDFLNTGVQGVDPFNESVSASATSLTPVDLQLMDVMGFDRTDVVACFVRGTLIRTETGETPVEDLAIGNRVMTKSGIAQPIRWIGRRAYDSRFIARNRKVLPIRIVAGALADGVPANDLWLSPEHALYLDGRLVAAGHLVNGATIVQAEHVDRLEYFNIEFDDQQVIVAEGALVESYVDCDNRLMFANAAEYAALYPHDERPAWRFCAPRPERGAPEVAAIRVALLQRAAALGYGFAADPDLHLIVDGRIVRPQSVAGRTYEFALGAGARTVAIASRAAVPAEVEPAAQDVRRLGVPVERLLLCDGGLTLDVAHSHGALRDGFHAAEPTHRWTDGQARLPEALLRPFDGDLTLRISLADSALVYCLPPETRGAALA